MRRLPSAGPGDDGQILVFALVFVILITFLVLGPLTLAWTDLTSSVSSQQQLKLQTTAQSAMDLAIDQFRVHQDDGLPDSGTSTSAETCPLGGTPGQPGGYDLTRPATYPSTDPWFVQGSTATSPPTYTANGDTVSVSCYGLAPAGGVGAIGRTVSFSVGCVSVAAIGTFASCPAVSGGVLLGADVEYGDVPGQSPTQVIIVQYWSTRY